MLYRENKQKETNVTSREKKDTRRTYVCTSTTLIASVFILSFAARLSAGIDANKVSSIAEDLFRNEENFSESSEKVSSLLKIIERRVQALNSRENELNRIEADITARKEEMNLQLESMKAAEEKLKKLIGIAEDAAVDDVGKIVSLYEIMKPKEAAAVFELMDPALAAGFLSDMNPDKASGVLAKLSPDKSYAISVYIAGRNVE